MRTRRLYLNLPAVAMLLVAAAVWMTIRRFPQPPASP
jgi:hypothetical protein